MPIKKSNTGMTFDEYLADRQQRARLALLFLRDKVGLECVKIARTERRYKDQTGNLRSSTGYCIVSDGQVWKVSGFEAVGPAPGAGPRQGRDLAREIAAETSGTALIVVAGMNYAKYVEAMGLNVLDSSETHAEKRTKELLKKLFE